MNNQLIIYVECISSSLYYKEIKKIAEYYDDTEISGTEIYVKDYVEDEDVSSHGYMFWWNVEDQECGIEYQNTLSQRPAPNEEPLRTPPFPSPHRD